MRNKKFEKAMIILLSGCLICTVAGCGVNTVIESNNEETLVDTTEAASETAALKRADAKTELITSDKEENTEQMARNDLETTAGTTERKTETSTSRRTEATTERKTETTTERRTEATTERPSTEEPKDPPTTEEPRTEHTHDWEAVYKTVHHDEQGHYEKVEDAPGYYYPAYVLHEVCNGCGYDFTANGVKGGDWHDCPAGGGSWTEIQVYDHDVYVPPIYKDVWVVDKPAWDEQVLDYYKCKKCGQRK